MQFDLIDIILSLGIVQGLFLAIALTRINNKNTNANKILVLILLITVYVLAGRMIIAHQFALHIFKWLSFTDGLIFLFGPLNYLYVRRLIVRSPKTYNLPFVHYLPAIICALIFFALNAVGESNYAKLYRGGYLYIIYNGFEVVGLTGNIFYLVMNFKLLHRYKSNEKNSLSTIQNFHRFLYFYLITIAIFLVFWLFSYINAYYFYRSFKFLSYDNIWITIPFFIYVVGYFSLKQPELFRIIQNSSFKPPVKRLNNFEISNLKETLESLLNENQIYLDSNLTLIELSIQAKSSANDISWLLNNEYKTNFYDFINKYRIKAFLERIENKQHVSQTILAIAMDVGFKSKSTFNKAFKTQMNCTPSQYIKSDNINPQVA